MLISSIMLMILANAISYRSENSLSFNRVTIIILLYTFILGVTNLYVIPLNSGIGVYGGLFHITAITQSFVVFISILAVLIMLLTAFYPKRIRTNLLNPRTYQGENNLDWYDLVGNQIRIIEYPLVILFILIGGMLLMSSSDIISMFLCLELQSYGLYIIARRHNNSKLARSLNPSYKLFLCYVFVCVFF